MRLIIIFTLALTSCGPEPWQKPGYAEARERLFVQCMELAATVNVTQRDLSNGQDDLHKAINQCGSQARMQATSYYSVSRKFLNAPDEVGQ